MLEPQDIKILEATVDKVVEKQLDAFAVVVDQKIEKQLDAFAVVVDQKIEKQLDAFAVVVDQKIEKQLDAFAAVIAVSFDETRKELIAIHKRIDTLTSHVDEFIHLHQKIDQEMTMVHARLDRFEEQLKLLQSRIA